MVHHLLDATQLHKPTPTYFLLHRYEKFHWIWITTQWICLRKDIWGCPLKDRAILFGPVLSTYVRIQHKHKHAIMDQFWSFIACLCLFHCYLSHRYIAQFSSSFQSSIYSYHHCFDRSTPNILNCFKEYKRYIHISYHILHFFFNRRSPA